MGHLRQVLCEALGLSDDEVLRLDMRRFFLQEDQSLGAPAHVGAYTPFDMERDHTGKASTPWYRSPGLQAGGDGDPSRPTDPHAYLGMHPPAAQQDPTASPPAAAGEAGTAARLAPPIWQLSAGSDTSKVLGANARATAPSVPSTDGTEEGEPGDTEGDEGTEAGEAQGQEQDGRRPQRGRD